ncbi:MAG: QueT transporter family protein [Thermanaeromonas sp.]|uniref:QueT transporter family protein n=1 Tax=Thermanaeromonas sp. TaxID=2003697 RepID=UPI00243EA962|nr:QueT transporter family protein [Thermanaeromonas sp.]MCG0277841.1 QueT transporter family protein [Thermanaeromonas sp.]
MRKVTPQIARGALIAAVYAVVTIVLAPISFGVFQIRVAEALTLLPLLFPEAIWGLFIGCLVSNIYGGLGPIDIFLGSLTTLVATWLTFRLRHSPLAYLPPIVLNGLIVGTYLSFLLKVNVLLSILSVAAGEAVAVLILGVPLIRQLRKLKIHY